MPVTEQAEKHSPYPPVPTWMVLSDSYELSTLQWTLYAIFELSVKVVPFPAGQAGAGVALTLLAVAETVDTELLVADAVSMDDVSRCELAVPVPLVLS